MDGGEYFTPICFAFVALTNTVAFERSPEEAEGVSHVVTLGKEHSRQREPENDIWTSLSNLQITNFTSLQLSWVL